MGSKGQNFIFSETGHVVYQIKTKRSVDQLENKNFDLTHTPDLWGWVERSDFEIRILCDLHVSLK